MGSRTGEVTLLFGTEEHVFRLTVARWEKVQEKCQAGPPEVARRLSLAALGQGGLGPLHAAASGRLGQWNVQDVREPLRQGLIGGGMAEEAAEKLCRELVDERPLTLSVPVALDVVMAALFGPPEEPLMGEPAGGQGPPPKTSRTAKSGSRKSGASRKSST